MSSEAAVTPENWRRYLSIARITLALFCLGYQFLTPHHAVWGATTALWTAYLIYSAVVLVWKSLEDAGYVLLGMLVDMIFFLLCASFPPGESMWVTSLFYLFVLLNAALLHRSREVLIVMAITLLFFFIARPTNSVTLSPTLMLVSTAALVLALQKKAMQDRLSIAARQAMMYRTEAEKAREAERQRLAADFHDGPLQIFVGMQMRLEVIKKLFEREPSAAAIELAQVQDLVQTQTQELRAYVRSMRPAEGEGAVLNPALRKLVENFERESRIGSTFVESASEFEMDPNVSREVLLIVREALHNVHKHAHASHVTVAANDSEGAFEVSIEDDGQGFPFSGNYTLEELELLRLGPISIRRRVRGLSGELLLESTPGQGSRVKVRIPV